MNALIPRATIEEMVAHRDRALGLYRVAFGKIAEAHEAMKAAHDACAPFASNDGFGRRLFADSRINEIAEFENAVKLPDATRFAHVAERLTDIQFWTWVIEKGDLERLMDIEAKNKLRDQLRYVPLKSKSGRDVIDEEEAARSFPPVTAENVVATVQNFMAQADFIFKRGVANVFSKLDRRFRSHNGFKIGSRVILSYFMDSRWGSIHRGSIETLTDIERAFAILDAWDEKTGEFRDGVNMSFHAIYHAIERAKPRGMSPQAFEVETEYFLIRCYKNGNAHLWMRRDDLVRKVNKVLAEYYGEVIGDEHAPEDLFKKRKTTLAKQFGFFPTPAAAVDELFSGRGGHRGIPIIRRRDQPRLRVLEPSAGTGNLARRCARTIGELDKWSGGRERYEKEYRFDNVVDCVEIQAHLAAALEHEGVYGRVIRADFLSLRPEAFEPYDLVVMNPPFDLERDIDHVTHAFDFLKPGGDLYAIMSAGTEFRETRKAIAFRELIAKNGGSMHDLPPASFAESGTYVNTIIVHLPKPVIIK